MENRELQIQTEVEYNLEQLKSDDDRVIEVAADNLITLGIRKRMNVLPRGRLLNAAVPDLNQDQLDLISTHLDSKDPKVRCKAASALSEWGSNKEAKKIRQLLETDADPNVQDYYLGSLGIIGGPEAAQGLARALLNTSGVKQLGVLRYIEDLITGGSIEAIERIYRPDSSFRLVQSSEDEQQQASKAIAETLAQVGRGDNLRLFVDETRRLPGW